jgi:hypothetical protein
MNVGSVVLGLDLLTVLINVVLLAIMVKLYSEYHKDVLHRNKR